MNAMHRPRVRRRNRLILEFLEDRLTPTCTITQGDFDANGTMDYRLIGDNAAQFLTIDDDPNAGTTTITLDCNGDGDMTDPGELDHQVLNQLFETFDIQLLGGDDQLIFNPPASDYTGVSRSLLVDLGAGNDSFDFQAINGADINQSSVTIEVIGGVGNDFFTVRFSSVNSSAVTAYLEGGKGKELATTSFSGQVSNGSVLDLHFDLGSQSNQFVGEMGDIDNATVNVHVVGGDGGADADVLQLDNAFNTASLTNNARLFVELLGQGGKDHLTYGLHLGTFDIAAGSEAHIRLDGGESNDVIDLLSSTPGTANTEVAGLWNFNINGGAGNDSITADFAGSGSVMDIDGEIRFRANGDTGNDNLSLSLATDADANGGQEVGLLGGAGNDSLTFNFTSNGNTVVNHGVFMLVDGGSGQDAGTINGGGPTFNVNTIRQRNCETTPTFLPMGAVTTGDFDGNGSQDIAVIGNNFVNTLRVIDDDIAGTTTVQIDANGDGDFADLIDKDQVFPALFDTIIIRGLGGNDNIDVQIPNGYNDESSRSFLIDGGKLNDVITVTQTNDMLSSNVLMELIGGAGNDQITCSGIRGTISAVYINGDLGVGSDDVTLNLSGASDAEIEIDFLLGKGTNSLTLDVHGDLPQARVYVDIYGGKKSTESDTVVLRPAVNFASWDSGTLLFNANLLAGDDSFGLDIHLGQFDLAGNEGFRVRVDGGAGADVMTVSRSFFSTGDGNTEFPGLLDIGFFGGDGADGITFDLTGNGSTFDLDGTIRTRLFGGGGEDSVIFRAVTHGDSVGNVDLILLGNAGADSLTFNLDLNGAETFNPSGFALVDGGSGIDVLVAGGTGFLPAELKTRGAG